MGSFVGHSVPGTIFFVLGLWWLYNVFYRFFYAKRFRRLTYKNISCFPCACSRDYPLESFLKIIFIIFGMMGEFLTGFENGHFTSIGNAQHMSMFFFFGLNSLIEICYYRKWALPPGLDYVSLVIAFSMEGFLFYNHLHGRPHMDIQVHMFLVYVITLCSTFTIFEAIYPKNPIPAFGRGVFTLLQGTWFYQIGFILYSPFGVHWDTDSHPQMMIVTLIFTWHIGALLVIVSILGFIIFARVQKIEGSEQMYQMIVSQENGFVSKDNISNTNGHLKNGETHQLLDSEGEEEV